MSDIKNRFERFRKQLPYELIPTNLPGVFGVPPLPRSIDFKSASRAELLKHGVFWPPPPPENKVAAAAWAKIFSRPRDAKNHVVPQFKRIEREPRPPLGERWKSADPGKSSYLSVNWSGCVLEGTWDSITALWAIPTISRPKKILSLGPYDSASWIGLDGFTGAGQWDVLQAGVGQNMFAAGGSDYFVFYEWFPDFPMGIGNVVAKPGHLITCGVSYVYDHWQEGEVIAGSIFIENETTGKFAPFLVQVPEDKGLIVPVGNSAEWIMECPDVGYDRVAISPAGGTGPLSPISLPQFTPVEFVSAFASFFNGANTVVGNPANGATINILYDNYLNTSVLVGQNAVTISYECKAYTMF